MLERRQRGDARAGRFGTPQALEELLEMPLTLTIKRGIRCAGDSRIEHGTPFTRDLNRLIGRRQVQRSREALHLGRRGKPSLSASRHALCIDGQKKFGEGKVL